MMLQSDKAPVAVADPAVADPEVAQKVRGVLAAAQHKYDIPADYVRMLDGFFLCYMLQVQKAGRSMDYFEDVLCQLLGHVLRLSADPYRFEPYHVAIREPVDYYMMGVEFIRGLVDQPRSVTRGLPPLNPTIRLAPSLTLTPSLSLTLSATNHPKRGEPAAYP